MYGQRGAREPRHSNKEIENLKKSAYWLTRAYKQGLLPPMNQFGLAFLYKLLDDDDGSELWIRRAAEAGVAAAQRMTGLRYTGKEDYQQAHIWLRRAAD